MFMCVFFFGSFVMGGEKHINKISPQIPGQSREMFVYVFFFLCVFFSRLIAHMFRQVLQNIFVCCAASVHDPPIHRIESEETGGMAFRDGFGCAKKSPECRDALAWLQGQRGDLKMWTLLKWLGWRVCRTKFARKISFRGRNFHTKNAHFSPDIFEPLFAGRPRFGSVRLRFGGGRVRAVPVFGSGGSSAKGGFLGRDGSGSGFGSWKTVPVVPVSLSVSGKTVPTVPVVSGSGSVPEPPCICGSEKIPQNSG